MKLYQDTIQLKTKLFYAWPGKLPTKARSLKSVDLVSMSFNCLIPECKGLIKIIDSKPSGVAALGTIKPVFALPLSQALPISRVDIH
jgi:hypothetical protein